MTLALASLAEEQQLVRGAQQAHVPKAGNVLLNPRRTMSVLRGPLTRAELERAVAEQRDR